MMFKTGSPFMRFEKLCNPTSSRFFKIDHENFKMAFLMTLNHGQGYQYSNSKLMNNITCVGVRKTAGYLYKISFHSCVGEAFDVKP